MDMSQRKGREWFYTRVLVRLQLLMSEVWDVNGLLRNILVRDLGHASCTDRRHLGFRWLWCCVDADTNCMTSGAWRYFDKKVVEKVLLGP